MVFCLKYMYSLFGTSHFISFGRNEMKPLLEFHLVEMDILLQITCFAATWISELK